LVIRKPTKMMVMPTTRVTANASISSNTEFSRPLADSTSVPSAMHTLAAASRPAPGGRGERSSEATLHRAPTMITVAAMPEAMAAAMRGPAPNTSLPWGSTSGSISPTMGAITTIPAAKAPSRDTTAAARSPRRMPPSR